MTRRAALPPATIAGVSLTHPDRVLYPEQGITKHGLAEYYAAVAAWILPHVIDRPLSLVRCPAGEGGTCFYQKHFGEDLPAALRGVAIAEKAGQATYAVVENLSGLVALVQIGVLELHPWGSTVARLERADRLVFDLDPDAGLAWTQVTSAAIELRALLRRLGLESLVKTTGGKGLHVVVPIAPRLGWERIRSLAHAIADRLAAEAPERYTTNMAKAARRGRLFIDYLRNSRGQTAIAPYSPRARPGASVATPIAWAEVEGGIDPRTLTVVTVPKRLAALAADPWAEIARMRQPLSAGLLRDLGV